MSNESPDQAQQIANRVLTAMGATHELANADPKCVMIKDSRGVKESETKDSTELVNRYSVKILTKVDGGQGFVCKAEDTWNGMTVAAKFTRDTDNDPSLVEAQTMARLRHPNIPTIRNYIPKINLYGIKYDVMISDWIDGPNLAYKISEWQSLGTGPTIGEVRKIAISIGDALSYTADPQSKQGLDHPALPKSNTYLHPYKSMHRDIKPGNIMLDNNDLDQNGMPTPMLIDFGITERSKTLDSMKISGTPQYMNPENAWGDPETEASEVFSYAIVMYELMTGTLPFDYNDCSNDQEMILHMVETPPIKISERYNLSAVLDRATIARLDEVFDIAFRKNKEERYQSVREFALNLDKVLSLLPNDTVLSYRPPIKPIEHV